MVEQDQLLSFVGITQADPARESLTAGSGSAASVLGRQFGRAQREERDKGGWFEAGDSEGHGQFLHCDDRP
jgi:hypothetical protein